MSSDINDSCYGCELTKAILKKNNPEFEAKLQKTGEKKLKEGKNPEAVEKLKTKCKELAGKKSEDDVEPEKKQITRTDENRNLKSEKLEAKLEYETDIENIRKGMTTSGAVLLSEDWRITDGDFRVFHAFHSFCKHKNLLKESATTVVSDNTIAKRLGKRRETVGKCSKRLERFGYISRKSRGNGKSKKTTLNQWTKELADKIWKENEKYKAEREHYKRRREQ